MGYGGTERVVSLLTEELVRRGHDVTLFASGDSSTTARLVPTVDTALWRASEVRDPLVYWAITAGLAYGRAAEGAFDVTHSHLDFHAFACASLVATPTVTTLHGRLDLPDLPRLYAPFPTMPVISISDSRRAPLPGATWAGTVYNAVDTDRLRFDPRGGGYLAWLGRIAPEKGLDHAIRIAQRAGLPLKVGARLPLKDLSDANCGTPVAARRRGGYSASPLPAPTPWSRQKTAPIVSSPGRSRLTQSWSPLTISYRMVRQP